MAFQKSTPKKINLFLGNILTIKLYRNTFFNVKSTNKVN